MTPKQFIQFMNLHWSDIALMVEQLHEERCKRYSYSKSGKWGGWTIDKTASLINLSHGGAVEYLMLAEALKHYPELIQFNKKTALTKIRKGREDED